MKVRCKKLIDSRGNPQERSPWLTLGKVYHVLEVVQDIHGNWQLRAEGDGINGPALFRLEQFEIISAKVPDTWVVRWNDKGVFSLTSEAWSQLGFWERFYDRDPEARKVFEEEKTRILRADP